MKYIYICMFAICLSGNAISQTPAIATADTTSEQEPKQAWVYDIDVAGLEALLNQSNDTTYVINFWATWCKPCVEELPEFNAAHLANANRNVRFILISTDSKKMRQTKLEEFVMQKDLKPIVYWINATNPNDWIDRVNNQWSGAIPATIIINRHRNYAYFLEGGTHAGELQQYIEESMTKTF